MSENLFNPERFLKEFWQQKPVVIKGFVEQFDDPLDGDELGGLALQPEVESRLVHNSDEGYQLSHGPFSEDVLKTLPDRNWTLLVQAVDIWLEEVEALKSHFHFIPSWRIDDVMVSFAAPGGGVGPHFDRYDVFLLQGTGSRTWRLGQYCDESTELDSSSGLSLLKEFKQEQEFTVKCGDVLYIPPGWAHWGISNDASLCYSIGFRAPSHAELLEDFSTLLMADSSPDRRYRDAKPEVSAADGHIPGKTLDSLWEELQSILQDREAFNEAFGLLVTKPRYPALHKEYAESLTTSALLEELTQGAELLRHPGSRFAYTETENGSDIRFYADGERVNCSREQAALVKSLCDVSAGSSSKISLKPAMLKGEDLALLCTLLSQGSLVLA